ncbi:MAG TPA: DMT family transporter [Blastocatellia bacterium]|nr:DMT family transporter [Blastocatellia bacterium]
MISPNQYSKGVLYCLIATISWGAMFPVMTSALTEIDPFTFTVMRYSLAGMAFLVALLIKERERAWNLTKRDIIRLWMFGTAGFAGFQFLVFLGQQLAGKEGALTASIMMATQPMLGLLVNWAFRKIAPPLYSVLFILMSLSGVLLVITKGDLLSVIHQPQHYGADALIILGALCWVIYTVGAAYYPQLSPLQYTTGTTLLGLSSVFALNAILLGTRVISVPSLHTLAFITPHLAYMAFCAGFIGVLSWNLGNRCLTPLNGVLFMDVVPITTFLISAVGGVLPSKVQVIGAVLTGMALIFNNLYLRHRNRPLQVPRPVRAVAGN